MKEIKDIRNIIANNLVEQRKHNNLTQNELAKKINYSDNTISRWEHGEVIPSIESLQALSEIYKIEITDFFKEDFTKNAKKNNKNVFINKFATTLLILSSIWFMAILIYIYSQTFMHKNLWITFIWAIPTSCLTLLSFSKYWKNKIYNFVVISVFIWTLILSFYLQLIKYNIYLIFIVGVPLQAALTILTFVKKE